MKIKWLNICGVLGVMLGLLCVSKVCSRGSDENKVYSKHRDLALHEAPEPASRQVAKAEWNEALDILKRDGRWLRVSSKDGEGWVYAGNVSPTELEAENKNDVGMKASGLTASAAARGLSGSADEYANRHSLSEVAETLKWSEKVNSEISREDAKAYLKSHKLGEFGGAQ